METNINFTNPPQTHARFGTGQTERLRTWLSALEQAGADKGFALFPERVNTSTASHIKKGKVSGIPAGKFNATTRNTKDGKADLYVQFTGVQGEVPIPPEMREYLDQHYAKAS